MKKLLFSAVFLLTYSSVFAQHSLEKLWESDSVTIKSPESVLFDAGSNSLYVSSMGSGSVVQLDLNGKVIKSDWVTGLRSNMGSGLSDGLFYTAEGSGVAVIDAAKSTIIKRIPVEGAGMLNDLTIDAKGIIYVSDTRNGKVYRVEGGKSSLYLENMPGANGLLSIGTDLFVVGSSSVHKVNANKEVTKIAEGFENGLDGIVMAAKNEFILSNFRGILYYLNADGTKQLLLDTREKRIMANDISYNPKTKTLYVPSFGTHRIIAYKVK
ncbi:SMP-30/gluconolactonase/LRE family protein [Pedobacter metabolipauper]|uniref:Sugar lactone lactonase YvrE n=1 Tax=Pedobacter metabolipauper TaxID=425513 RepID=A0A4R6SUL0_9SPHI|nr:ATP/GTP-binding protein [Pedobacter metabolipauper]TDQ08686.1 sugar lactone lactonase YvrE [Pedobacter metabolipauper]